ncbi:hypothetical protein AVEN_12758-1 [Araneus ventricosus]|uniref:Uncharacterized protein n=1 Tax=Araneus ventricosus TaxID=182803 RepID=A0A4Y2ABQ4_ARAVE|nr:hypothetical protein AVEN_12758-1 [Araneus ventricosus]
MSQKKSIMHDQKYLQNLGISFEKSIIKIRSLKVFLKDKRNGLVEGALQFAKDTCEETGIPVVKRTVRRKKIMSEEKAADDFGSRTEKVTVRVH